MDEERPVILITGATDGLGRRVAEDLARRELALLLHGRNPQKGEQVLATIREKSGNQRMRYYNADLSSLDAVRQLARTIEEEQPRLDVLVNNAGIGVGSDPKSRATSADGFELRLAVNYLAPFLFTRLLLPLLRRTAADTGAARVVNVASAAQQAIDFDDPMLERDYSGMRAYSQSKLALVMFTFDLARELEGTGVSANVLHPASLMDTKMVREGFGATRTSVDEGARAVERLITDEDLKGISGKYHDGLREGKAASQAYDAEARRRLRERTERWLGL